MDETAKSEKTYILWATNMDDAGYADILFLVGEEPPYGVGINCGGHVIVKPLRDWHALGSACAKIAPTVDGGEAMPNRDGLDGTDRLCSDCPPIGYPTDKTRCNPCPRRDSAVTPADGGHDAS